MKNEQDVGKKEIEDAKKKAEDIVKEAEEYAREVQGASLLYVDDMLVEVSLAAKRAKESIRIIMQQAMEDFDQKIDIIESNQKELLEDLRELSENGTRPIKKAMYEIKIDEAYIPKKAYDIKINDGIEKRIESIKSQKQPIQIKIADEWKDRIQDMIEEDKKCSEVTIQEKTEDEVADGFQSTDFDLDEEYFNWLEKKDDFKQL
ncbi:MAG: hypothetical protein ACERKN_13890 [Velocimicrobium sp.]